MEPRTPLTASLLPSRWPLIWLQGGPVVKLQYLCLTFNWALNGLTLTGPIKFKEMCVIELLHINYKYLLVIKAPFRGEHLSGAWITAPQSCSSQGRAPSRKSYESLSRSESQGDSQTWGTVRAGRTDSQRQPDFSRLRQVLIPVSPPLPPSTHTQSWTFFGKTKLAHGLARPERMNHSSGTGPLFAQPGAWTSLHSA